jgi:hypothetical protein
MRFCALLLVALATFATGCASPVLKLKGTVVRSDVPLPSPFDKDGVCFVVDPATKALTLPAECKLGSADMREQAIAEITSSRAYGLFKPAAKAPVVVHGTAHPGHGTILPYFHMLAGATGHFEVELSAPGNANQVGVEISAQNAAQHEGPLGGLTLDRPGAAWPEQPAEREVLILLPPVNGPVFH